MKATLRPYQQTGVQWLYFLTQLGLGACLADNMGLGKTIQVLALLAAIDRRTNGAAQKTPEYLSFFFDSVAAPIGRRKRSGSRRG